HSASISLSNLAHTNQVFRVGRHDSGSSLVIRRLNGPNLDHLDLEVDVLDHLAGTSFGRAPQVVRTVGGDSFVNIGGRLYVAFAEMVGTPLGNYNDRSGLTHAALVHFAHTAGMMSRHLSGYRSSTRVAEKNLFALSAESPARLRRLMEYIGGCVDERARALL